MGRTGFWNKKKVSEARNYPSGVAAYCRKHGTTMSALRTYCARHNLSYKSKVLDSAGNNIFTFKLFQEALNAPSGLEFCKTHNLSYQKFLTLKKYGFPSKDIKKKDVAIMEKSHSIDEVLTEDDMNVFDTVGTTQDVPTSDFTKSLDDYASEKSSKKHRFVGFWNEETIMEAKNYPGTIEEYCKAHNTTVKAFQCACYRLGMSALKHIDFRASEESIDDKSYWNEDTLKSAQDYVTNGGNIREFCENNGQTYNSYIKACHKFGLTSTGCTRAVRGANYWTPEKVEEAINFEHGPVAYCKLHRLVQSTFEDACVKFNFNIPVSSNKTAPETKAPETVSVEEPLKSSFKNCVKFIYKNGRVKEKISDAPLEIFITNTGFPEIDELKISGDVTITII